MTSILMQLIIGLVVTILFEQWMARSTRKARSSDVNLSHASKAPNISKKSFRGLKSFIRLTLSPFIGFFLSAATSGILEAEGHGNIPLGSSLSYIFIIIWTVLVWQLLYRFGPIKRVKE